MINSEIIRYYKLSHFQMFSLKFIEEEDYWG